LFGTHTHVQTADQSVSQRGTAYITDLGMCGSSQGVIGMHADVAVERFVTGISQSYKIAPGPAMLNGVLVEFCAESGKALKIERIHENLD
ncbi:MAG: YmdB family metallophosphoesterase, partial [Bdellovibrionales bacterium]|nr:YmdB family metallophosphoesterase [Bdellovibrionales bacterium]